MDRKQISQRKGRYIKPVKNGLIGTGDIITINVSNRQYKENKEIFDSLGIYDIHERYCYSGCHTPEYMLRCKKSDFEKEYITTNED